MAVEYADFSLDRMERAVEKVRERMLRATSALERNGIPYAVAGGKAVALWVASVDESAVRNTPNVDILLRRGDWHRAGTVFKAERLVYRCVGDNDASLVAPDAKVRDAVGIIFAGEVVRRHETLPNPDVTDSVEMNGFVVLSLEASVQIKLVAFRRIDRTHLRDLIEFGLIDETWCSRYPTELATRLKLLIDTPEG